MVIAFRVRRRTTKFALDSCRDTNHRKWVKAVHFVIIWLMKSSCINIDIDEFSCHSMPSSDTIWFPRQKPHLLHQTICTLIIFMPMVRHEVIRKINLLMLRPRFARKVWYHRQLNNIWLHHFGLTSGAFLLPWDFSREGQQGVLSPAN